MSTHSVMQIDASPRSLARALAQGLAGLLLATSGVAGTFVASEQNTLARFHDPVVVRGADFANIPDRRTARLRVYRVRGDTLEAIPYQFDQFDASGEIVAPLGAVTPTDSTKATSPLDEPEFVLDSNDELVFMAKDAGGRADFDPAWVGGDWALEIEVRDPVNATRGWVYVVHFPDPAGRDQSIPPRSSARYAHFDVARDRVVSTYYELQYAAGYSFFNGMRIAPEAGGTDRDIVNSMKIRVRPTFSVWVARWSPKISENDFQVEVEGVRNGPVRAVRRIRQRLSLGGVLPVTPQSRLTTYYYFSSFLSPAKVTIPGLALRMLSDFEFIGVTEFAADVRMTYWDGANPGGIDMGSGSPSDVATNRATTDVDHNWWAIRSPGGSCLHVFLLPEEWKQWGVVRGTTLNDPYANDDAEPEDVSGPALGYSLLNMTNLQHGGAWEVQMATVVLRQAYEPGDEFHALDMLLDPLETRVHPLRRRPRAAGLHAG